MDSLEMSVDQLLAAASYVLSDSACALRIRFLDELVDNSDESEEALAFRQFSDRQAYVGYMWDYFIHPRIIDETEAWLKLKNIDKPLFAMSDIHSTDLIPALAETKLDPTIMLRASSETYWRARGVLFDDVYFFDDTVRWVIALTHEWINGERYCLEGGCNIG